WFSIQVSHDKPEPVLLTPGEGMVEHVDTSVDGRWLYYTANTGDLDRRQLWRVEVGGGVPEKLTSAPGISTFPAVLASEEQVAVLHAGSRQPLSVALVPATGGAVEIIAPEL